MSSTDLCRLGKMVCPIMLAQEAEEISEAKAAELIGVDIVTYREHKRETIIGKFMRLGLLTIRLRRSGQIALMWYELTETGKRVAEEICQMSL